MKQDVIVSEGEVVSELGNSFFKVVLDSAGQEILCTISGKIRKNRIRIMAGDKVEIELSPYDLSKGRITRRLKTFINKENINNNNNKNKSRK